MALKLMLLSIIKPIKTSIIPPASHHPHLCDRREVLKAMMSCVMPISISIHNSVVVMVK